MENHKSVSMPKVIRTFVCLSPPLISALDAQAEREGVFSRSAIIRRACTEYLERQKALGVATREAA